MEYFYRIPKEERIHKSYRVGFFYVPFAGSSPIHGLLEADEHDLGDVTMYNSKEEAYTQCMIDYVGPQV